MAVLFWEGKRLFLLVVEHEISGACRWVVYEAPWSSQFKSKQIERIGTEKLATEEKYNNNAPDFYGIDALVEMKQEKNFGQPLLEL